ncbi:cytochrome c [Methylocella sp. CPCC 101449]|uniref:c-type cytochrome n=1 Tax=Methylocella sp. CPCC 101449 TaxID=2987531 RepID=UPI0028909794|nr:cytochrome c [Methylocella sp. CPCC 101449]MDT2021178.1 cytochrome c [Methylocella sp. CPCC 101449]HEV2572373.1 cytochrome c [Beijerinckiaceae bacterium]
MSRFRNSLLSGLMLGALLAFASGPLQAEQAKKPIGLGRIALPEEIAAWDIDIRPDGQGLPPGKGSVKEGEEVFLNQCAACHGEFGEGAGRWPVLVGGRGTLDKDNPDKTIGSYWPFASTTFDYIRRAMPFGNAQSLTPDEVYALTAFLLNMNDIVKDDFVLSRENFSSLKMPNVGGFYDDDRETTEKAFWKKNPCMKDCKPEVSVLNRARVIDVTPDSKAGPKVE